MCGKDELFVISVQRLPSGEDIHIDNETGALVTHDSVRLWLRLYSPTMYSTEQRVYRFSKGGKWVCCFKVLLAEAEEWNDILLESLLSLTQH